MKTISHLVVLVALSAFNAGVYAAKKPVDPMTAACTHIISVVSERYAPQKHSKDYYCWGQSASSTYLVVALHTKHPAQTNAKSKTPPNSLVGYFAVRRSDNVVVLWNSSEDKPGNAVPRASRR